MDVLSLIVLFAIAISMKGISVKEAKLKKNMYNVLYFFGFYLAFTFLIMELSKYADPYSFVEVSKSIPLQLLNVLYGVMMFIWVIGPNEKFIVKGTDDMDGFWFIVKHPMTFLFINRISGMLLLIMSIVKGFLLFYLPNHFQVIYQVDSMVSMISLVFIIIGYWINAYHLSHCMEHYQTHVSTFNLNANQINNVYDSDYPDNLILRKSYELYHDMADYIFLGAGLFMNRSELSERGQKILGGLLEGKGHH